MSGNFDDNEFESLDKEFESIDHASLEAEIEAFSQDQKSAYFFGSVDQSKFYKYLEQHKDLYTIESKFHQSGPGGFLPLSDPGVCNYMCDDFSQALIEGRYTTWKEKIEKFDKEFIEKLRAGQYDKNLILNLGTQRPFGPSIRKIKEIPIAAESPAAVHPEEPIAAEPQSAEILAVESEEEADKSESEFESGFEQIENEVSSEELKNSDKTKQFKFNSRRMAKEIFEELNKCKNFSSCLDASCVKLQIGLTRTGIGSKFFGNDEFGHALVFTIAVDEKGRLDNNHLLFMDPNCGIIKINNREKDIKDFLDVINENLFHTMQLRNGKTYKINHSHLPDKDSLDWHELDKKIQEKNVPIKEDDYALCKLCRLDNFLQGQIARLEIKGILEKLISPDTIRLQKLKFFQDIRDDLHKSFQEFGNTKPEEGLTKEQVVNYNVLKNSKFKEIIEKIDKCEVLKEQRGLFSTKKSTPIKEFEEFKKKYSADTQESSTPPNSSKPHSKKP